MVEDVPGFICMFKPFIFTHSNLWALFLGEKKITVDVAPPATTQPRSLPVKLVFRAILVEVEKADTRFSCPILRKEKHAHWHSRAWRLFLEGDKIWQQLNTNLCLTPPCIVATKPRAWVRGLGRTSELQLGASFWGALAPAPQQVMLTAIIFITLVAVELKGSILWIKGTHMLWRPKKYLHLDLWGKL